MNLKTPMRSRDWIFLLNSSMSAALKYQTLDISKTFSKYNEICLCCVEELRASVTLKGWTELQNAIATNQLPLLKILIVQNFIWSCLGGFLSFCFKPHCFALVVLLIINVWQDKSFFFCRVWTTFSSYSIHKAKMHFRSSTDPSKSSKLDRKVFDGLALAAELWNNNNNHHYCYFWMKLIDQFHVCRFTSYKL